MIVIDASVAVDYLIKAEALPALADRILAEDRLAAPELIDYEIGSALRRHWLARDLDVPRVFQAVDDFRLMRIDFYPADMLFARAWQLRQNVSFYDASYVALAEMLDVPLATRDKRLAAARGLKTEIILF